MPSGADQDRASAVRPPDPLNFTDAKRTYRVVIDEISSSIETADSFAIKFSLLTRSPLARMKHVVRRLPAKIWEGTDRSRAERVLALIEEAGGKGSIVEPAVVAPPKVPEERETNQKPLDDAPVARSCAMCGFPMEEEEKRCGFCMTPAGAARRVEPPPSGERRASVVSRRRLVLYAACFAACAAIAWIFLR